jgi:hypothetical protein
MHYGPLILQKIMFSQNIKRQIIANIKHAGEAAATRTCAAVEPKYAK